MSPSKGIVRFGKHGKLSPRFVGPFEVIKKVGPVAYRLSLSSNLAYVHNVFHVSMLRRCMSNTSKIIIPEPAQIQENLTYVKHPVEILDQKEQVLRNKVIPLVMVLWQNHSIEEATWEREDEIREKYPHLFDS